MSTASPSPAAVEVAAAGLQGPGVVFCPDPKVPLGGNHPRDFIVLSHGAEGKCPYCGTVYRLKAGEKVSGGH